MRVTTSLVRLLAVGCAVLATAASAQTTVPAQPKRPVPQFCFAANGCARTQPATVCFAATGASKDPCARTRPVFRYAAAAASGTASTTVTGAQFAPLPAATTKQP
ncbi:MAG TPA: hypothetical protein VFE70_09550 [Candidatus Elarobacter sp.]|nr:hypothetical protein [Candidatus Elarobacter sp.]